VRAAEGKAAAAEATARETQNRLTATLQELESIKTRYEKRGETYEGLREQLKV
jgi:hypothetical protein